MNHLIFVRIAGITAMIMLLLSSCELQKRRYSNGYYVKLQASSSMSSKHPPAEVRLQKLDIEKSIACAATETGHRPIAEREAGILKHQADEKRVAMKHNIVMPREKALPAHASLSKDQEIIPKQSKKQMKANPKSNKEMKDLKDDIEQKRKRRAALIIGISLLLMAAVAIFAAPAIGGIFVLAEPALTALNVVGAMSKFRATIVSWIVIFILDLLVSVGIYKYYKDEKPKLALTNGILRLIYSAFLGVGIMQLLRAASSAPNSAIYGLLSSFYDFWNGGLIVFGLHLIALGILYNNEGGKKWINITIKTLLIVAGAGYMILNIGLLIAPNPVAFKALIEPVFLIPQIVGEVLFAIWMLVKGGKKNSTLAKE
jgi:uncharacterized membrane protein